MATPGTSASNVQGVPNHVRSSMGLYYNFRELSENLRINHLEKLNEPLILKFNSGNAMFFEYYMLILEF